MVEKKGIKESKEILAAVKEFAKDIKEAAADGKFDWKDLYLLIDNYDLLKNAFENADEVKYELSDLDSEEAKELVLELFDIVALIFLQK